MFDLWTMPFLWKWSNYPEELLKLIYSSPELLAPVEFSLSKLQHLLTHVFQVVCIQTSVTMDDFCMLSITSWTFPSKGRFTGESSQARMQKSLGTWDLQPKLLSNSINERTSEQHNYILYIVAPHLNCSSATDFIPYMVPRWLNFEIDFVSLL